jgi:hypothetical protein
VVYIKEEQEGKECRMKKGGESGSVAQLPLEHERIIEYLQSTTFINVHPIYTKTFFLYKGDG